MKTNVLIFAVCSLLVGATSVDAGVVTGITDNAITVEQSAPVIAVSGTPTAMATPSTITNDITGVVPASGPYGYYPIGSNISEVNVAYSGGGGLQANFFRWTINTTNIAIDEVIFSISDVVLPPVGTVVFDAPVAPVGWTAYTTGGSKFLTFKTLGGTQPFLTGGPLNFLFEIDMPSAPVGSNFNLAMQAGNPEPGSMALAAVAMTILGGGAVRRRRNKKKAADALAPANSELAPM